MVYYLSFLTMVKKSEIRFIKNHPCYFPSFFFFFFVYRKDFLKHFFIVYNDIDFSSVERF